MKECNKSGRDGDIEDYLHPRSNVALPIQTDSIYDNLHMKPMNVCIKPKLPLAWYLPWNSSLGTQGTQLKHRESPARC